MRCLRIFVAAMILMSAAVSGKATAPSDQVTIDERVLQTFPQPMAALVAAHLPTDDTGLIGRNRKWGKLYAARFQMGAGQALRLALIKDNAAAADRALLALRVGLSTVEDTGVMQARVPEEIAKGRAPDLPDLLSGAAFFLSDACPALAALDAHPQRARLISEQELEDDKARIARSLAWLAENHSLLKRADERAPNRLLFDALALHSCGQWVGDRDAVQQADTFVGAALQEYSRQEHYFIEGGGYDTSYQAVSIHVGLDLLLNGYAGAHRAPLEKALREAAIWLAGKIDAEGKVESAHNTRTCGGGEAFMGEPKQLSVTSVFTAMAYAGAYFDAAPLTDAATRVVHWAQTNAGRPGSC